MSNKAFIAIFAAVALLIVGVIGYSIGNLVGVPDQKAPASIYAVDYHPAYTSGTGSDKKRHSAEWKVHVRLPNGQDDYVRSGFRPPSWQYEGASVRATYRIGRWSKTADVSKIEQF